MVLRICALMHNFVRFICYNPFAHISLWVASPFLCSHRHLLYIPPNLFICALQYFTTVV